MARILVLESVSEDSANEEIARLEDCSVTLGRDPDNSIALDSVAVSRRHAAIVAVGTQWVYKDLGSTNGSWVNGVKVLAGQLKLIRGGDTIQLSDFSMSLKEEDNGEQVPWSSLLVFYSDNFQGEYELVDGEMFRAGGPNGDVRVDGEDLNTLNFSIQRVGTGIELSVGETRAPVIVNRMATQGVVALHDRDELTFGLCKVVVNVSPSISEDAVLDKEPSVSFQDSQAIPSKGSPDISQQLQVGRSWESEASRRRSLAGRKYVFGAAHEDEIDPSDTMSYRREEMEARVPGFGGMSMHHRLSAVSQPTKQSSESRETSDLIYVIFGILILVAIGVAAFLFVHTAP